jgi:hypothetical protein
MTDTKNRFQHDSSPYERPNFPFRCGRETAFGKPCPRGPTGAGACQGMADCQPFQTRKVLLDGESGEEREIVRWECRRPAHAGGPCAEGPRPDGACACTHPPCAPRPTIRRQRGRWALLAVAFIVAGALALMSLGGMGGVPSSLDPGALSGKHAQFTAKDGCVSCHVGHSETLAGWADAIFERKSISDGCVSCHAFGTDEAKTQDGAASPMVFAAHNYSFPSRKDAPTADCQSCHTEHRGEQASITPITDGQCQSCHTQQFDNFATSHPAFDGNFPHESARTIKFSHTSHLSQHFEDPRYAKNAPKAGCVSCHTDQADGRLLPGSFESGCAGCHEASIKSQGFAVMGLPELTDAGLTAEAAETCGFAPGQVAPAKGLIDALAETLPAMQTLSDAVAAADPGILATAAKKIAEAKDALSEGHAEYQEALETDAVSLEELPLTLAFLLNVPADDPEAYSEATAAFLVTSATEGRVALETAIEEKAGDPNTLLAGLSPEMVTRVTCAWTANAEYEPLNDPDSGSGWTAGEFQVSYKPTGHADPVAKAWIGFALANKDAKGDQAAAFSEVMLSPADGPGRCFKCHVAPAAETVLSVTWAIPRQDARPFTTFDHTPHLNVLDSGLGCATCHQSLDKGETLADAAKRPGPHANEFKPITAAVCADCHREGAVRQDCSLCHKYHVNPSIKKRTM